MKVQKREKKRVGADLLGGRGRKKILFFLGGLKGKRGGSAHEK